MNRCDKDDRAPRATTRRSFLERVAQQAAAGALAGAFGPPLSAAAGEPHSCPASPAEPPSCPETAGKVKLRILGKTGLRVSEIGFGGHSWAYARVPDAQGRLRKPTLQEAMRMISLGLDLGVNFFDSCTPEEEHTVPGEVIKRLNKRNQVIVSARLCHKMKGRPDDREIVYRWVDQRLKLWQTDYFDILMLTNEVRDTPQSGYWDMSYCVEAIERLKSQGKIRYAGFGCHFEPHHYYDAFARFGLAFDICSVPYNVRHRAAEAVIPAAKKVGLGMVTIKPFARGALLEGRELAGADAGLARDMLAFVLENPLVDCCICGMHTEAHVRENLSASWTRLSPQRRRRLQQLAATTPCPQHSWLECGWLC